MIYHLPTLLFLVCAGGSGGAFAAPSEPAAVRVPLELTLPPIQSDQYTRTDYIDGNENPVEGSGEKTKSCSIQPLIDYRSLQPANEPLYPGFCATSVTCGDSFQGVSFANKLCGDPSTSSSLRCCIPPSKPIYCAAPHANSKCLNSNENRKAECVGGTFVKDLCPGGKTDDVQCCVIPQDAVNKDWKNHNAAAASDRLGPPMDWGYDETATTKSTPTEEGSETERIRFPAQDIGWVDNRVGGSWGLHG